VFLSKVSYKDMNVKAIIIELEVTKIILRGFHN
jgi:hypothetical protein